MSKKERVLVLGGGFGGVKAALELANDSHFSVTLLSDDTDLRYYPTLYHTATGGKRANSSIPLATIFQDKAVEIILGSAQTLDRKAKTITAADKKVYEYDTLIIALGVVTNYFGIKGLAEYAYNIKSQAGADRFKTHLHKQLLDNKRPDLHYVIAGAGPTGIELAGALPGYLKCIMENHGIEARSLHIDLIETSPRLLPRFPKDVSRIVRRRLRRLGITLYVSSRVEGETADELTVGGKPIRSHTMVWTAGVTNHPFFADNEFATMERGKVGVNVYLQAEENIFVLGDNANTPFSGLAQTALRDGVFVAKNLRRQAAGKRFRSYVAKPPITVIPVGPHWAIVMRGKFRIYGRIGWILREAADLIGFHDLEPWKRAAKQWYSGFASEDNCDTCSTAASK